MQHGDDMKKLVLLLVAIVAMIVICHICAEDDKAYAEGIFGKVIALEAAGPENGARIADICRALTATQWLEFVTDCSTYIEKSFDKAEWENKAYIYMSRYFWRYYPATVEFTPELLQTIGDYISANKGSEVCGYSVMKLFSSSPKIPELMYGQIDIGTLFAFVEGIAGDNSYAERAQGEALNSAFFIWSRFALFACLKDDAIRKEYEEASKQGSTLAGNMVLREARRKNDLDASVKAEIDGLCNSAQRHVETVTRLNKESTNNDRSVFAELATNALQEFLAFGIASDAITKMRYFSGKCNKWFDLNFDDNSRAIFKELVEFSRNKQHPALSFFMFLYKVRAKDATVQEKATAIDDLLDIITHRVKQLESLPAEQRPLSREEMTRKMATFLIAHEDLCLTAYESLFHMEYALQSSDGIIRHLRWESDSFSVFRNFYDWTAFNQRMGERNYPSECMLTQLAGRYLRLNRGDRIPFFVKQLSHESAKNEVTRITKDFDAQMAASSKSPFSSEAMLEELRTSPLSVDVALKYPHAAQACEAAMKVLSSPDAVFVGRCLHLIGLLGGKLSIERAIAETASREEEPVRVARLYAATKLGCAKVAEVYTKYPEAVKKGVIIDFIKAIIIAQGIDGVNFTELKACEPYKTDANRVYFRMHELICIESAQKK